jgi:hypothetical protein
MQKRLQGASGTLNAVRTTYKLGLGYDQLVFRAPRDECGGAVFGLPMEFRAKEEVAPVLGLGVCN